MHVEPAVGLLLLFSLGLGSVACGGDEIDPSRIEGGYVGRWQWRLGAGPISLTVASSSTAVHDVAFYETSGFRPGFNADGMTPDARGRLEVEGADLSLTLRLRTDSPRCTGTYAGTGTRDAAAGTLELQMSIVHDCAEDGPAVFTLTKVSN